MSENRTCRCLVASCAWNGINWQWKCKSALYGSGLSDPQRRQKSPWKEKVRERPRESIWQGEKKKKTHQAAKGLKAEHDGKGAQKPRKCTEKREKKTFRTWESNPEVKGHKDREKFQNMPKLCHMLSLSNRPTWTGGCFSYWLPCCHMTGTDTAVGTCTGTHIHTMGNDEESGRDRRNMWSRQGSFWHSVRLGGEERWQLMLTNRMDRGEFCLWSQRVKSHGRR